MIGACPEVGGAVGDCLVTASAVGDCATGGGAPPGTVWYRSYKGKSLGEDAAFSRLSEATYFEGGALGVAVIDEVRFQSSDDGVLLCEPATTNYCVWSEDITQWNVQRLTLSDEGLNALGVQTTKAVANTDSHTHRAYLGNPSGAGAGEEVCTWMLMKYQDEQFCYIQGDLLSGHLGAASFFDVQNVTPLAAGAGANASWMEDTGADGWVRAVAQATATGASRAIGYGLSADGTGVVFAGNDTDAALLSVAQSEIGVKPSSYVPTSGAMVSRAADVLSYSGVPTPNETRYKTPEGDVDVDDWDGVVATLGKINAIEVYPVGERP